MDKGWLIEFEQGLKRFDAILQEWKAGNIETKETYYRSEERSVRKECRSGW